jgi:hypothetical protein
MMPEDTKDSQKQIPHIISQIPIELRYPAVARPQLEIRRGQTSSLYIAYARLFVFHLDRDR